jgi:hypothetical protein
LSKLADTLSSLGQTDPAPIGFGQPQNRSKTPLILLAGRTGRDEPPLDVLGALDLLVFDVATFETPKPPDDLKGLWGVALSSAELESLDALKEAGCHFVLIQSGEASSVILRDDGMDRGYVAPAEMTDRRARAIEDMPFEFLVIRQESGSSLATVEDLISLQETMSLFNMHVFLEVGQLPPVEALEALRDLPVSAVLFDADNADVQELTNLREAIAKLEQREDRGKRLPTAPLTLGRGTNTAQPDYDGDDWEDD